MEKAGPEMDQALAEPHLPASGEQLVSWLNDQALQDGRDYITAVQQLPSQLKTVGSGWLLKIETSLMDRLTV